MRFSKFYKIGTVALFMCYLQDGSCSLLKPDLKTQYPHTGEYERIVKFKDPSVFSKELEKSVRNSYTEPFDPEFKHFKELQNELSRYNWKFTDRFGQKGCWMVVESKEAMFFSPEGYVERNNYKKLYGDDYRKYLAEGNQKKVNDHKIDCILSPLTSIRRSENPLKESEAMEIFSKVLDNYILVLNDPFKELETRYFYYVEKADSLILIGNSRPLMEEIAQTIYNSGEYDDKDDQKGPAFRLEQQQKAANLINMFQLLLDEKDPKLLDESIQYFKEKAQSIKNSSFFQNFHKDQLGEILGLLYETVGNFRFCVFWGKAGTGKDTSIAELGKDRLNVADVYNAGSNLIQSFEEMLLADRPSTKKLQVFAPMNELIDIPRGWVDAFVKRFVKQGDRFYFIGDVSKIGIPLVNVLIVCTTNFEHYAERALLEAVFAPHNVLRTIKFGRFNIEHLNSTFIPERVKAELLKRTSRIFARNLPIVQKRLGDSSDDWYLNIQKRKAETPEQEMLEALSTLTDDDIDMRMLSGTSRGVSKIVNDYIKHLKEIDESLEAEASAGIKKGE